VPAWGLQWKDRRCVKRKPPFQLLAQKIKIEVNYMKRMISSLLAIAVLALPLSGRVRDRKESERLYNCGTVLKEIMDIPEDIPQDLIDNAE
jgi:hypothetical protein